MSLWTPDKTDAEPGLPVVDDVDAGVVEDARRRQRQHRLTGAAVTAFAVAIAAGLLLGFGGAGGDSGSGGHHGNGGNGPSVAAHVTAPVSVRVIRTTRLCYRVSGRVPAPYPHVVATDYAGLDIPCGQRAPKGYGILGESDPQTVVALVNITFKARVAANNRHSVYEFSDGASGPTSCGAGRESATTGRPIRAGQTVMIQDAVMCPGNYGGIISYQPHGAPGRDTLNWGWPVHDGSIIVGRYSYTVR